MAFGKAFHTRAEANKELKRIKSKNQHNPSDLLVRRMSKKAFPRRKKLLHVGSYMDFLNFE